MNLPQGKGATSFTFEPIGIVHSPFTERVSAPRQGTVSTAEGEIELFAGRGYELALADLAGFERLWVLFVFHRNAHDDRGFRPKVQPPRSPSRRGLFATRSPHRPNPIGLSAVRLLGLDGLRLRIAGHDLLDETPVLDLKPYIPYADAFPESRAGWVDSDPVFQVEFEPRASRQLAWLAEHGVELRERLEAVLELGPWPNRGSRIRREGSHYRVALGEWRAFFEQRDQTLVVTHLSSGYARDPPPMHAEFTAAWPDRA